MLTSTSFVEFFVTTFHMSPLMFLEVAHSMLFKTKLNPEYWK